MYKYLEIKKYENGEVVKRIDITEQSDTNATKIENGINRNINHEGYYTFPFESENKLETIE